MRPPATIRSAAKNGINPAFAALSFLILMGEVIAIGLIGLAIVVVAVACSLTYRRSPAKRDCPSLGTTNVIVTRRQPQSVRSELTRHWG
jgi:hypothetical protein